MAITRIPVVASVDPEAFITNSSGGEITQGQEAINVIYDEYPDGRLYATQRPGITVVDDASDQGVGVNGRGIHRWELADIIYIANNDDIYFDDYTSTPRNITAGKERVYFHEVGDYLVILDPENDEGWYFDNSVSPTIIQQITDPQFPSNIVGGGVSLDGYLFVMDEDGIIWNSDLNDPTAWTATNFLGSAIAEGEGIYLALHNNHVCALGLKNTEFFYNAGNPVGSPLQRRQDVSHTVGPLNRSSVIATEDRVTFVGSETGQWGLYTVESFQMRRVSPSSINYALTTLVRPDAGRAMLLASSWIGEHLMFYMTFTNSSGSSYVYEQTLVYDMTRNLWSKFETNLAGIDAFAVIDTTYDSSGFGNETGVIFANGDVVDIQRSNTGGGVIDFASQAGGTENVECTILLPDSDFDTITNGFCHRMAVVGGKVSENLDSSAVINIDWSDDHYRSFSSLRTVDATGNKSIPRLGRFKRRAFRLNFATSDLMRIEAIELDIRKARYA